MKTRFNHRMLAGIGAIVASLLSPAASPAAYVNTYTANGVNWYLAADFAEGSKYSDPNERPENVSVVFSDVFPGSSSVYTIFYNMTLTGFGYTGSGSSRDIAIPGNIGWDSGGSLGVGIGPLQFIASGAFSGKDITSVTIPRTIIGIKTPCFRNCGNLASIEVDGLNTSYCSEDGVLYGQENREKTQLLKYPEGKEGNYLEVPTTVTSLVAGCLAEAKLSAVRFSGDKPSCGEDVFKDSTFVGYCPESWGLGWGEEWNGRRMYPLPAGGIRVEDGVTNCYEVVDGVLWRAELEDGGATIMPVVGVSGDLKKTGDVAIPARLGGVPVTAIGEGAFEDCDGMTSVVIPESLTDVGDRPFAGCTGLETITVAAGNSRYASKDGVMFTKDMATLLLCPEGKTGTYSLPEGVTAIEDFAFEGCDRLTAVVIPESVTDLEGYPFAGCTGLETITVAAGHPRYASQDGVMFTKDMTTLLRCPEGKTGAYAIPEGVAAIGDSAFFDCHKLTSLAIPASVVSIEINGGDTFRCDNLLEVRVAGGNPAYAAVGGMLFTKDMKTLLCRTVRQAEYDIPDGVETIADYAFDKTWMESVSLPSSLKRIEECAFRMNDLTNVFISAGVVFINPTAFEGNNHLAAFKVDGENQAYAALDGLLVTKDLETLVSCPGGLSSVTIPECVAIVGEGAFEECYNLETLRVPASWEGTDMLEGAWVPEGCEVEYYVVEWQYDVENGKATVTGAEPAEGVLVIPATLGGCPVTAIDGYAFGDCDGLTAVVIPGSVTNVDSVFYGCTKLEQIFVAADNPCYASRGGVLFTKDMATLLLCPEGKTGAYAIPEGVEAIGDSGFFDCDRLTSLSIPASVVSIEICGWETFRCGNLLEVRVAEDNPVYAAMGGMLFTKDMKTLLCRTVRQVEYVIPEGVETIADDAFALSWMESVTLPSSLKRIEATAFRVNCLTNVFIPAGVVFIDPTAFESNESFAAFEVDEGNQVYASQGGVLYTKDMKTLVSCPSRLSSVTLPASLEDYGDADRFGTVENIYVAPGNAVYASHDGALLTVDMKTLLFVPGRTTYTIPAEVETVGHEAFTRCYGLTEIQVAAENRTFASQDGVLFSKDMKKLVCYPRGIAGSYEIPDGVETIGEWAFVEGWVDDITIPPSVTTIERHAFAYLYDLGSLTIPATVTRIEGNPFYQCYNTRVQVDEGNPVYLSEEGVIFTRDGKELVAFLGETDDGRYEIPEGVETIAASAFDASGWLESVSLPSSLKRIEAQAFRWSDLTNVFIPAGVVSIDPTAFEGTSDLAAFEVDAGNQAYAAQDGVLFSKDMKTLVVFPGAEPGPYEIPEGVENIGDSAFGACWKLTSVTIPESVSSVGKDAFKECDALETLRVPASWNGTATLEDAGVPKGCEIVYLDGNPVETTSTTPVPVPFEWLEGNAKAILEENGGNYEAAAGATAANGLAVWKCYLMGLSATDAAAEFKVKSFVFEDGQLVVEWDPDLNADGRTVRVYRVWARKSVELPEPEDPETTKDGWRDVTGQESTWDTNGWRFFRVGVELPKQGGRKEGGRRMGTGL